MNAFIILDSIRGPVLGFGFKDKVLKKCNKDFRKDNPD